MGTGIGDSYHAYDGTGGTIQLTGGEIFTGFIVPANYTAGGYDIGDADIFKDTTNWTVSIGGSAKVFLFNNRSSGLTTSTHINKPYDPGTAEVYGVTIPEGWQSAGFGAYLRLCTLSYDINGGSGDIQVKRNTTTSMREDGNNVDLDFEMVNQAANNLMYDALVTQVNNRISITRYVINGK
jgi:hypothetical protein